MIKSKPVLGIFMTFVFTLVVLLNIPQEKAAAKTAIPEVKFVSTPKTEYTVGDRVRFDISAPNYANKVEYRVILWKDNTKSAEDLWNASNGYPNRYYTKWQPSGNSVFTLGWPIFEPGSYRITVYVKRVGVPNNKAALKGMNCDSYKESVSFTIKPKNSALDKDGQTYGSKDGNKIEKFANDIKITAKNVALRNASVEGNILITGNDSVLNNITVSGKVVIDPGKDGNATLENVKASKIEVLSGGTNSIHIKNVKADEMTISSQSTVRVVTDGDTVITSVSTDGYVVFDKKNGTFGTIKVVKNESGESVIEFHGNIQDSVVVEGSAKIITPEGSSIGKLIIAPENAESKVVLQGTFNTVRVDKQTNTEIASGSKVTTVDANAKGNLIIENGAKIEVLHTNDNGVNVNNQGIIEKQETSSSETGTDGKNNGNSGNVGDSTVYVRRVGVDVISAVIKRGQSIKLTSVIYPGNASNKAVSWSSSNVGVASVNSNGLVSAVSEGNAVITVKSADGNYTATTNIIVVDEDLNSNVVISGNNIKLTLTSSINDEVTIKIVDSNGLIKYIGQTTLTNGNVEIMIPLETGTYSCYIKGLETKAPIEFIFSK